MWSPLEMSTRLTHRPSPAVRTSRTADSGRASFPEKRHDRLENRPAELLETSPLVTTGEEQRPKSDQPRVVLRDPALSFEELVERGSRREVAETRAVQELVERARVGDVHHRFGLPPRSGKIDRADDPHEVTRVVRRHVHEP